MPSSGGKAVRIGDRVDSFYGAYEFVGNDTLVFVDFDRALLSAPADGTGGSVGPALNRAANQVASEVAAWIGNSSA